MIFANIFKKNVAPKNRGDFNDCLPYETLILNRLCFNKQPGRLLNYFLVVSAANLVESAALVESALVESVAILVESILVESTAVESVVVVVVEAPPQAANAVVKAKPKRIFFMFCFFKSYIYTEVNTRINQR
jgi:hypothetical protein